MKPDLDSKAHIKQFVESFYDKVLSDSLLAHIFIDVASININAHLPLIQSYWEKLLLGDRQYQRHTMNVHRQIDQKFSFSDDEFQRWLVLFKQTASEEFSGEKTDRAVILASTIAKNMQDALNK